MNWFCTYVPQQVVARKHFAATSFSQLCSPYCCCHLQSSFRTWDFVSEPSIPQFFSFSGIVKTFRRNGSSHSKSFSRGRL